MSMVGVLDGCSGEKSGWRQVHKNEAVQKVLENVIDQGLEHYWGVGEAERITKYSKWPRGVLNAVVHSSPSRVLTRWYALRRSTY